MEIAFYMTQTLEKTLSTASEVRQLRGYIDDLLTAGIQPARIAVEAGVSLQRLKAWINETGGENIIPALLSWKAEVEQAAAHSGGFVLTPTASKIIRAFDRARQPQGKVSHLDGDESDEMGIALIYGASGVGKTEAAEWYRAQHKPTREIGNWPVVIVRCTGKERDQAALHSAILDSMTDAMHWRHHHQNKMDALLSRIPPGSIIIFDEAQLLSLRRLDELRYFPDQCGIAIALMGNLTGYKELIDAKITQIMSRVGGARVIVDAPCEGDVDALLDAWEIGGRRIRESAVLIGTQDGGLRLLAKTVNAARLLAKAKGKAIEHDLFMAAAVSVGAWGNS